MSDDRRVRIGIALSGGGFRAAAFHLGVLKRLEELGVLARLEAMSTVSGGSITGALYALRCAERGGAPGAYSVDALISEMRAVLTENLRASALFGTPLRAMRTFASVVSARISRIGLMIDELDKRVFGGKTLDALPRWIAINATNLRTGKGWRFMQDRAGDYLAGATEKTSAIRIAEAVGASAAYPGLTDSYAFATDWSEMRGDLLSESRWERPPAKGSGYVSRWRERYGKSSGSVRFPLVDGGLYDNEGINALRGHKISHAIVSAVAPPESDVADGFGPGRMMRVVEVVHDRLGAATRQLAHEMSHGVDPGEAARSLVALADSLRTISADQTVPAETRAELAGIAAEAHRLSGVGVPPRGPQFTATAQVLLHRTDLAANAFSAASRGGYDVPQRYRGLDSAIVAELSRARTDLDALEPRVVELLIAQGYFLADFLVKLSMPELVFQPGAHPSWYTGGMAPEWDVAHATVQAANADPSTTIAELKLAAERSLPFGRVPRRRLRWIYRANLMLVAMPIAILLALVSAWLMFGAVKATVAVVHLIGPVL